MSQDWTRRQVLRSAAAAGLLAALDGCGDEVSMLQSSASAGGGSGGAAKPFRFVHLTDIHVQTECDGDKGFAAALKAVERLRPRPDFILTGGDLVYDALEVGAGRSRSLFELYKKILADNTSLPVYNTLGNHDVFGWHKKSGANPGDAGYGKAMAKEYLGWSETYHRFDHKGWRFFCLDNIQPGNRDDRYPFTGRLDDAQVSWLKGEMASMPRGMPIITCEHIPTVTATLFDHGELNNQEAQEWRVSNAFVCGDAAERLKLYADYNVRLCLSGHIHERDRVEFLGPTFINDGAVCGSWWKGPHRGVQEGFGVIDCRPDGSFAHQYLDYGWEAKPETKKANEVRRGAMGLPRSFRQAEKLLG